MKKLQVAAAVIKADDSAVDVFSDVVKTIGTLSIASVSNEKLISASERYFDIEESPEVEDLLAQNYLEALEEIEEEDDDITVQLQVSREQSKVALHL